MLQELLAKGEISADDLKAAMASDAWKTKEQMATRAKKEKEDKGRSSSSKKEESSGDLSPTSQMRRVAEKYPEACGCRG